ncbi:MAG: protein-arginine kinase [Phycisphaeraceae bacterium]|nr:MAG: protein-arginine kinase [Phycisphaeraceae bacterium]
MIEGEGQSRGLPAFERGTEWLRGVGASCDVVMSSRVRLARNLAGFVFQPKANDEQREDVLDRCRAQILAGGVHAKVMWIDLRRIEAMERSVLVERQLISAQLAAGKPAGGGSRRGSEKRPRGVAVGLPDERMSIMVNEEDHLRMQVIRSGLSLGEALDEVVRVDETLGSGLEYAFSARFGYLTCCPTNVGTGARFSVMMHLPGLRLTGEIEKVKRAADDMGLAVRGFHGEGSETAGDLYQLSNQTTLGKSEQVLLGEIEHEIVPRVVDYERHARRVLMERRRDVLEDQVQRAIGTGLHARLLATGEAMAVLSAIRLGAVLGVAEGVDQAAVNGLMLSVQPAHLQRVLGREMSQAERKVERATLVRAKLGEALGAG